MAAEAEPGLGERNQGLRKGFLELLDENDQMRGQIADFQQREQSWGAEGVGLNTRIGKLTREKVALEEALDELVEVNVKLDGEVATLTEGNAILSGKVSSLEVKLREEVLEKEEMNKLFEKVRMAAGCWGAVSAEMENWKQRPSLKPIEWHKEADGKEREGAGGGSDDAGAADVRGHRPLEESEMGLTGRGTAEVMDEELDAFLEFSDEGDSNAIENGGTASTPDNPGRVVMRGWGSRPGASIAIHDQLTEGPIAPTNNNGGQEKGASTSMGNEPEHRVSKRKRGGAESSNAKGVPIGTVKNARGSKTIASGRRSPSTRPPPNRKKSRRTQRSPSAPKPLWRAYDYFQAEQRRLINNRSPGINPTDLRREISKGWKNIGTDWEKYNAMALADWSRFESETADYNRKKLGDEEAKGNPPQGQLGMEADGAGTESHQDDLVPMDQNGPERGEQNHGENEGENN